MVLKSKLLDATVCQISQLLEGKSSYKVGQTHEIIGFHTKLNDIHEDDFEAIADQCDMFKYAFIRHVSKELILGKDENRFKTIKENYRYEAYHGMVSSYKLLVHQLKRNSMIQSKLTRRYTISFVAWHCFSHINFMFRGDKLIVNVHMRSCDVYKHLYHDIYLAYYLGSQFKKHAQHDVNSISMNISIDSLHVYEDDIEKCRKDMLNYVSQ